MSGMFGVAVFSTFVSVLCLCVLFALESVWNFQDSYIVYVAASAGVSPMCPESPLSMNSSSSPDSLHSIFARELSTGFQNPPAPVHSINIQGRLEVPRVNYYSVIAPTQWLTGVGI